MSGKLVFCLFLSFPSGLLPESLNGVNRQPSKGLKSNRQKGYILPSTVKIADLIKSHLISGDLHKYQGILAKKNLLTVKLTSNILKNTLLRHYKALQKNKQTNKQKTNRKEGLETCLYLQKAYVIILEFDIFLLRLNKINILRHIAFRSIYLSIYLSAARLAQLGERRSAEREVASSNPGRTNTQGLKNN